MEQTGTSVTFMQTKTKALLADGGASRSEIKTFIPYILGNGQRPKHCTSG